MQATCYVNIVHPTETHDMVSMDDKTSHVIGRESLDYNYNRCILPPVNSHKRDRLQSKRRESQKDMFEMW